MNICRLGINERLHRILTHSLQLFLKVALMTAHWILCLNEAGVLYVIGRLLKGLKNGIILRVFEIVLKKLRMKMSLTYMFFLMVYNEMSRHFLKSIALRVMSQEFANKLKILMLKLQTSNVQNRLLQVNLSIMVETRII